jgi:hypothetical protein
VAAVPIASHKKKVTRKITIGGIGRTVQRAGGQINTVITGIATHTNKV